MGYIDKLMGRNEEIKLVARQHWIVLLGRVFGSLFAFLVFLALGLLVRSRNATLVRAIAFVVLLTMLLPIYQIVKPIVWGRRRGELFQEIWRPVLIALAMLILGLALLMLPATWTSVAVIALILSIFPLVDTVRICLDWYNERYVVTNRRVMLIKGIINKHVSDSALEKVNDVVLTQSMVGRLMAYGDVEIITGSDIGVNLFKRIARPVDYKREMLNQKEDLSKREETPPADEDDVPELLEKLNELRQRGILTDAEFEAKKQQLLDQL
jgi:hypothetical protein